MPRVIHSDHPDFKTEISNLDVIIIWPRLISRYIYGHVLWTIRHFDDRVVYSINEEHFQLASVKKEKFFEWMEREHPADMEWLIWNLDKIGF